MKKQIVAAVMTMVMAAGLLTACGGAQPAKSQTEAAKQTTKGMEAETEAVAGVETEAAAGAETEAVAGAETEAVAGVETKTPEEEVTLLLAAAASLKNVCEKELIPMFESRNPGIQIEGTYDSSGKLQTQIEEGLEADVFLSAAVKQMTALEKEGLIASDTIVNLLENKIVLIVPTGGEEGFDAFEDIADAESIALGDPESVPAGQYAREALSALGVWDGIQDRVSFGTNVTEVLNQVAAGSADAGIVYATDAASMADQVVVAAEAPENSLKQKVIYPAAVLKASAHEQEAKAFVEFLQTDEAMAVFESYGFVKGN